MIGLGLEDVIATGVNLHDISMPPTNAVHLDCAYNGSALTRTLLEELGFTGEIVRRKNSAGRLLLAVPRRRRRSDT